MATLFDPISFRGVTLKHRIVIPPMASYHADRDGVATGWHVTHYGRWALGGAALVMVESTGVTRAGRITHACLGLWDDAQIAPLARVAAFLRENGAVPAIQLNHAGRKASFRRPWHGYAPLDDEDVRLRGEAPWPVLAPSPLPLKQGGALPHEMTPAEIQACVGDWAAAARRADAAGFDCLEIHAAHGYQVHQFLSPISNRRGDGYGGDRAGRMRFALELAEAVRAAWPADKPLFVRVSAVDGVEGGWALSDTVALAKELKRRGVDAIDCSSGGIGGFATNPREPRGPGFQVPFAEAIRREAAIPTIAVGLITTPAQAAAIIAEERADVVAIGREALLDPNWPNRALMALRPESGHAHFPPEVGWWLDARARSFKAG